MHARTVILAYPSDWLVPVNPAHEEARFDCERWLRDIGVLCDEGTARVVQAMNVGWYGGAPFPAAAFRELTTITRFFTLWILHDELLEGLGAQAPEVLGAAVRGDVKADVETGPHLRGWCELGQRFRAAMSEAWLTRFSRRFAEWLASLDSEARLAAEAQRSGRQPSFSSYMAVRAINIGVLPTACWIEYAAQRELSETVLADPDLALAERLASRIITFQNDAAGLDKDATRGWPNAVLAIAGESGRPLREAFDAVVELHDRDVRALREALERLDARHGAAVRFWARGLGQMVAGLGHWQMTTARYTATLPSGESVRVVLGNLPPASDEGEIYKGAPPPRITPPRQIRRRGSRASWRARTDRPARPFSSPRSRNSSTELPSLR